jgi:multidrug efflux pump subunit AcrB
VRDIQAIAQTLSLPQGLRLIEVYNQGRADPRLDPGDPGRDRHRNPADDRRSHLLSARRRGGILAALSVPTALIATFLAIDLCGETLNLMSLGGMAIAIGLVIDDAIVVVEAIALRLEEGDAPHDAVRHALHEITAPVVGTTITTVAVLAPLAFLSGLVGRFFSALAITLAPRSCSPSSSRADPADPRGAVHARAPERVGRNVRARLEALRSRAFRDARASLDRRRRRHGCGGLGRLAGKADPLGVPSGNGRGRVRHRLLHARGNLARSDRRRRASDREDLGGGPGVARWTRRTGAELGPITATETNSGDIAVALAPARSRPHAEEMIDDMRSRLEAAVPEARIEFVQILEDVLNDLSGAPRPIEVRTSGEDPAILNAIGKQVGKRLEGTPSLVDFYDGIEAEVPIRDYRVNSEAAVRAELDPAEVARNLSVALHGRIVGAVPRFDRLVPVRVRFPDDVRFDPDRLDAAPLAVAGAEVPIGSFATP